MQTLIVLAVLGLGGSAAMRTLSGATRHKADCLGQAIVSLTPGGVRCGQGVAAAAPGPDNLLGARPIDGDGVQPNSEPMGEQSYKDLSPEELEEWRALLEQARTDEYLLADWLRQQDPRDQARMFDLAADSGLLAEVLGHASSDEASRRAIVDGLRVAFQSGSLSPDELAREMRPGAPGTNENATHERLADVIAATGVPGIIEAYADGEINVLHANSDETQRLPAIATALAALSPGERDDLDTRRPDIETVMDIYERHRDLDRQGLKPDDTDLYSSIFAIRALDDPDKSKLIHETAARYGISPSLLEGVLAAEIDFDRKEIDVILDHNGERTGMPIGEGWGVAAVHSDTVVRAMKYMVEHKLPGWEQAQKYDWGVSNAASFEGSVEGAAIVLAWLSDVKVKNGGTIDSAEDMAVIWGAYRTGIAGVSPEGGGYASAEDYAHNRASGTESYPPEFQVGGNAYQSIPYFEYFMRTQPR